MDGSSDSWQVVLWLIIGVSFLSSEAFTGSFHLLFFGLAALLVAVIASLGMHYALVQISIFFGLSVLGSLLLQERLKRRSSDIFELGLNARHILAEEAHPNQEIEIMYQGAVWRAVNRSSQRLKAGQQVAVLGTEGVKLLLSEARNPFPKK